MILNPGEIVVLPDNENISMDVRNILDDFGYMMYHGSQLPERHTMGFRNIPGYPFPKCIAHCGRSMCKKTEGANEVEINNKIYSVITLSEFFGRVDVIRKKVFFDDLI